MLSEELEAGGCEGVQVGALGQTTGPQLGGVAARRTAVPWGYTSVS